MFLIQCNLFTIRLFSSRSTFFFPLYNVEFQNKSYQLLPEVLFAIVINEIKRKIEREFIIENTVIELPRDNSQLIQRIKISLQGINLKGIEINDEEISYDYQQQDDYLQKLLKKKEMIDSYKRMIEKAKEIHPENKDKLDLIDLNKQNMFKEEELNKELSKQF